MSILSARMSSDNLCHVTIGPMLAPFHASVIKKSSRIRKTLKIGLSPLCKRNVVNFANIIGRMTPIELLIHKEDEYEVRKPRSIGLYIGPYETIN